MPIFLVTGNGHGVTRVFFPKLEHGLCGEYGLGILLHELLHKQEVDVGFSHEYLRDALDEASAPTWKQNRRNMFPLARHASLPGFTLLIAMFASTAIGNAQATSQECFVELPVFDPLGVKVPFEIIEVKAQEDDGSDLLTSSDETGLRLGENDRLYFPKNWIANGLVYVKLKAVEQDKLKEALGLTRMKRPITLNATLVLASCQQRTSLRIGQNDTNFDVAASTIKGRIIGCQLDSDWWIRAMPMFGGHNELSVYEGFIHTDGSFSLIAQMRGERHILIVGKGRHPVTAVGVDVKSGGGKTDVGALDLSAKCPK